MAHSWNGPPTTAAFGAFAVLRSMPKSAVIAVAAATKIGLAPRKAFLTANTVGEHPLGLLLLTQLYSVVHLLEVLSNVSLKQYVSISFSQLSKV